MINNVKYNKDGLVPAIVQDYISGQVLMLAYMNEESLNKTIEAGTTYFYSRSRKELWNKGATSGNYQYVKELSLDCDSDAILVKVQQEGVACHTGEKSCFYKKIKESPSLTYSILYDIEKTIKDRREEPEEGSYTNYLLEEGLDKILKKVGEEATEVIIAAKNQDPSETIYEMSDLIYHSLVLLNEKRISLEEIFKELNKRYKKVD